MQRHLGCVVCVVTNLALLLAFDVSAADGTLVLLRNSSPRITSIWGGGGSEQIVLKSDGTVWDWGLNGSGELGNGTTNNSALPLQVLGPGGVGYLTSITSIMGGELHNFALRSDGTVWSWGMNFFGQIGDGSTNWGSISSRVVTPVQVFGLTSVKSLGGRGYHSMALKTDGTIWCWGDNASGQLGNGVAFGSGTNTPVQVVGLANPVSISGGGFFSLAMMADGSVRSWGDNGHGQLGDGSISNRYTPVTVIGLSNIVQISGGWFHAIALKSDGTAWSWGENSRGELGDGTTIRRTIPVQVIGLSNVVSVWGGDNNSMALRSDGTVWKWGVNQYGELGDGTSDDGTVPHPLAQQVPGLTNVAVAVCRDYHCICIKWDGTVWVWGDNRYGGCGDLTGNNVLRPRLMPGLVSNNTIPYSESFESFPAGFSLPGTNSWYSDNSAAAVIAATNYASAYSGTYPIVGLHAQSLQVNGLVTNRFCPSLYSNVFVDLIAQVSAPTNPVLPAADTLTNAAFAFCVTANRHLAAWNRTNPPAAGNGWTELIDTDISTNSFCRITLNADYATDANGIPSFSIWVNGIPSTNPRPNYAAADSSQPWFGEIVASGRFLLDDLVVGAAPATLASVFSLTAFLSNGQQVVSFPTGPSSAQYGFQRYYALESCTNLAVPAWQGVPGLANILGVGQTVLWTNTLPGPNTFLRARVWLGQ